MSRSEFAQVSFAGTPGETPGSTAGKDTLSL
jgi:hypothetical protein